MDPSPPTAALLDRARRGDRPALSALAEAWWPTMRRWAYVELGDRRLAEDASQDALVRLVRFIDRYDPARPFGVWLRTLVRNTARDVRRHHGRHAQPGPRVELVLAPDVDRAVDLRRKANEAFEAFAALPDRQREVVERVDHGGQTPSEVAEELGVAAGTVRSQLFAARRTLRRRLVRSRPEVVALLREP